MVARSSKASAYFYQATGRHVQEDSVLLTGITLAAAFSFDADNTAGLYKSML
jgi:hypothetical protein